jgi:hypothetical protein
LAYSFAREVYPDLLSGRVNAMPFWDQWLTAYPRYRRQRISWRDTLHRAKLRLVTLGTMFIPLAFLALDILLLATGWIARDDFVLVLLASWGLSLLAWILAVLLFVGSTLVSERLRRRDRWRKQLAALLSERHGLAPGGLAALLESDDAFALHLQRFLGEHRVPYTVPLYDGLGRYLFAAPGKIDVLASALLRAVGRGRDNELFVLMIDLLELDEQVAPLARAVRVALARHHQVVLICPWPAVSVSVAVALALPGNSMPAGPRLRSLLRQATRRRFHAAYQRMRRSWARLGVPVICAASDDAVPLVLERMERLHRAGRKP